MKPKDRERYEKLFESLQPINGLIPGNKVKGVLMDSKLPLETLGKIWDLADQDKDGSLDKHEFIVAMHLVYQALDKRAIPTVLPIELQRPQSTTTVTSSSIVDDFSMNGDFVANFPTEMAPPPQVPPLPIVPPHISRVPPAIPKLPSMPLIDADLISTISPPSIQPTQQQQQSDWVVTPLEKIRYDGIFVASDLDNDGLVSGLEIKDVFLKSGVQQSCLAHIWALCDTNQSGKLTSDQFALAMWFVERKKNGIEPPQILAPNMIPPSVRSNNSMSGNDILSGIGIGVGPNIQMEPVQPTYSNPELEMISKEIEELAKERRLLETDIAQKEADIRIKNGEVRSLQVILQYI